MLAAIDAGSNTLRLLVGRVVSGRVLPEFYQRRISRLAGNFSDVEGLSFAARERTLSVLKEFRQVCDSTGVTLLRAVGTAAFRQAVNGHDFATSIMAEAHLPLEIITGHQEAELMVQGVLSALNPVPSNALIMDIGGGSTELVLCVEGQVVWSNSLSLGVVRLSESSASTLHRQESILKVMGSIEAELTGLLTRFQVNPASLALVGTAGTLTTLAALDMQMIDYDWRRVNNYTINMARLLDWQSKLIPLNVSEREALPGMDAGRGDLILPGLEILLCLMRLIDSDSLVISDFGLLEGVLLSLENQSAGPT